jgi:hypothetical protein
MNMHSTKLRQPQYPHLVGERRERLKKMLDLKAPEVIIIMMAEHYLRSFKLSAPLIWQWFKFHKLPPWALWLLDADFRAVCRDHEFEDEMREILAPTAEDNPKH